MTAPAGSRAAAIASRTPEAIVGVRSALPPSTRLALGRAVAGKRVVLTGASSGIGRAFALELGAVGATVALLARRLDALVETAVRVERAGGRPRVYTVDLREPAQIDDVTRRILDDLGRVDLLINDAGVSIRRPVERSHTRRRDFERTMAVNYFGALGLILAFLAGMREQGGGHIVNVSSAGTQNHTPVFSAYNASKGALDAWSRTAGAELAGSGVRITTVHMPLVATAMTAPTGYRRRRLYSAEEGAALIARAVISRPVRVAPRLGTLGEVVDAAAPRAHEAFRGLAYRRMLAIEELFLWPRTIVRSLRRRGRRISRRR